MSCPSELGRLSHWWTTGGIVVLSTGDYLITLLDCAYMYMYYIWAERVKALRE